MTAGLSQHHVTCYYGSEYQHTLNQSSLQVIQLTVARIVVFTHGLIIARSQARQSLPHSGSGLLSGVSWSKGQETGSVTLVYNNMVHRGKNIINVIVLLQLI